LRDLRIRYTIHALERLAQRRIDRKLIADCLEAPDRVIPENGKLRCIKRINNKVLVAIYKVEGASGTRVIITAFISSKIYKYLP